MLFQLKNYNFYIIFFLDLLLFSLAWFCAHLIRFEFALPDVRLHQFWHLLPFVLLIKSKVKQGLTPIRFCFYTKAGSDPDKILFL